MRPARGGPKADAEVQVNDAAAEEAALLAECEAMEKAQAEAALKMAEEEAALKKAAEAAAFKKAEEEAALKKAAEEAALKKAMKDPRTTIEPENII